MVELGKRCWDFCVWYGSDYRTYPDDGSRSGRVLRLVEKPDAEAIALPATLSETGVFRELATLTPHEGIEPYEINVPFWSIMLKRSVGFPCLS